MSKLSSLLLMRPRDIGLFVRSARTDAVLTRLRARFGPEAAFDAVYTRGDPWASSDPRYLYQRRKYEVLSGLLPERRFARALDLGTGLGLLARRLAGQADEVLGLDISQVAVEQAQARHGDLPNLRFAQADVLDLPISLDGGFDLVAVIDTLYYLSAPLDDGLLKQVALRIARLLRPGGLCLLANHFFFAADRDSRLSRRIHRAFAWSPGFHVVSEHRRPFYLASVLELAASQQLGSPLGPDLARGGATPWDHGTGTDLRLKTAMAVEGQHDWPQTGAFSEFGCTPCPPAFATQLRRRPIDP